MNKLSIVLIVLIIQSAWSLPPEYFRNGRSAWASKPYTTKIEKIIQAVCLECAKLIGESEATACLQPRSNSWKACFNAVFMDYQKSV